jgi:hypothetical protein
MIFTIFQARQPGRVRCAYLLLGDDGLGSHRCDG